MKVIYSIHAKLGGTGTGTTACHAVRGLERHGYLKKVICTSHNNCIDSNKVCIASRILNHAPMQVIRNEAFDLLARRYIDQCDVFHGWNGACLYQLKKAKRYGAKTVTVGASSHPLNQYKLLKEEYERYGIYKNPTSNMIIKKSLKEIEMFDLIMASSKFVYDSFMSYDIDESKLVILPFGVDTEKFKPSIKDDDVFRVVFVGLICLRKGVQYLLQAWKELNIKNSELVLVGKLHSDIITIIDKYKNKMNFKIISHVDNIVKMYNKSSVFVLPSIEEGSALVTYEAMACGLPQIVTENCGSVAINGKHGFVIPIRDVKALKEKIQYFYDNENEARMIGKAARKCVENYTWEKYGDNYVKILEDLV